VAKKKTRIVAFCCENSGHKAVESLAGTVAMRNVEVVSVPCAGRVEVADMLRAVESGATGVLVAGCPIDNCKYVNGNRRTLKRAEAARKALQDAGVEHVDLRMELVSSVDSHKLAAVLKEMKES